MMFKSKHVIFLLLLHNVGPLIAESDEESDMMMIEDEGPAPDIWSWKLIRNRYLPHVRRRDRLYLTKDPSEDSIVLIS